MSALLGILGVVMLAWGVYHLTPWGALGKRTRVPGPEVQRERDLLALRDQFAGTEMSIEDYEASVQRILQGKGASSKWASGQDNVHAALARPDCGCRQCHQMRACAKVQVQPDGRWEVHVHNAPSGHHLHLHLDG